MSDPDLNEPIPYLLEPEAEPDQVLPEGYDAVSFDRGHPDVSAICSYLGWETALFEEVEGAYFAALSDLLVRNGALRAGTTLTRDTFRDAVRDYQKAHQLGSDGLPGADTLWALHAPILAQDPLGTTKVKADKVSGSGGYDSFTVRADVAADYLKFYGALAAAQAAVTSAGALRPLNAEVSTGRSATSLHYSGLALDMATDTGMDWGMRKAWKYLIEQDGKRWRVYVDSPGAPLRKVNAVIWEGGRTRSQVIEGHYLDLTALAQAHGFAIIGPRSSFPESYISAEWWHLQYTNKLVPGISLFGVELRRVYTEATLAPTPPWRSAKNLYWRRTPGKGWF